MKRLSSIAAIAALAVAGITAAPGNAEAWWRGGWGVGIVVPPVVVAPPPVYYAAPPPVAYYAPPPRRVWIPPHWEGPYFIRGHWA